MKMKRYVAFNEGDTVEINREVFIIDQILPSDIYSESEDCLFLGGLTYGLKSEDDGKVIFKSEKQMKQLIKICKNCGSQFLKGSFCSEECKKDYIDYLNN